MTLVLSVHGRDTLWLVADRRLSYGRGRRPIEDAIKIMDLDTVDGRGLLAYAGLGATARGTQPSDWMSAVLRGRGGLTFEQSLSVLAHAATSQLPKHLASLPRRSRAHFIIAPAYIQALGPRLYGIDVAIQPTSGQPSVRFTNWVETPERGSVSVRIATGGTGGYYLAQNHKLWQRALLSLVHAHDRGRVPDRAIADRLARLNYQACQAVTDDSVGPRCVVVWRRRPDAKPGPAGAHQFYIGTDGDDSTYGIPTVSNGMDIQSIVGAFMQVRGNFAAGAQGTPPDINVEELNRTLAKLPSDPDETLR